MLSIDPKIWGSSAWKLLHDISFHIAYMGDQSLKKNKKDQQKILKEAHNFFMTLRYILPCTQCQYSFDVHILHIPFPKKTSDIPRWLFDIHNRVNDTLTHPITKPIWDTWVITYPEEMKKHTLRDVWPFIQSVVEVHPDKDTQGMEMYIKSLHTFFTLLWKYLYQMDAYHHESDKAILKKLKNISLPQYDQFMKSKSDLRSWITSIGKTIHSKQLHVSEHQNCTTVCHST